MCSKFIYSKHELQWTWCCETRKEPYWQSSHGCNVIHYLGIELVIAKEGCYKDNLAPSSHLFLALAHLNIYHVMMSTKALWTYPKSRSWISYLQNHGSIIYYVYIGLCYSITVKENKASPQNNHRYSVDLNVKSTTVRYTENSRLDSKGVIKKFIVTPKHLSIFLHSIKKQ